MMKERLQGVIVGLLIGTLSAGSVVYAKGGIENIQVAYNNIKVYKDNQLYTLKDSSGKTVEPFVYNGTTYLPLRSVADLSMKKDVEYDSKAVEQKKYVRYKDGCKLYGMSQSNGLLTITIEKKN